MNSDRVRLWSYNLFLRPPPIKNNQNDFKKERFQMITRCIANYDIVCFQELFQTGSFRLQQMIASGIEQGFQYWAHGEPSSFLSGKPVDSGLAVLSRFPIEQSHFQSYGIGILSDSASDKGYIYCKIRIGCSALHLFNTHLQASYLTPGADELRDLSIATRKQQLKILKNRALSLLKKNYSHGDLVLMVGDFNINANDPLRVLGPECPIPAFNPLAFHEYGEMISLFAGEQDGEPIIPPKCIIRDLLLLNEGYHPPTYGQEQECVLTDQEEWGMTQRLDYIFQVAEDGDKEKLKPEVKSCKVEKGLVESKPFFQLSDHYGLRLQISIK